MMTTGSSSNEVKISAPGDVPNLYGLVYGIVPTVFERESVIKLSIGAKWGSFCTDTFSFTLILDDFEVREIFEVRRF